MKTYPFSQQTLGQILEDKASMHGDKAFLQYEDGPEITYSQVNEITNRIANGFIALGFKKGDKVATFLPNSLEVIFLWFGMSKAGIIDVPVNLANIGDYLAHIINNSDSRAIVIDSQLIDRLKFIENDIPKLEKVIIWSKELTSGEIPKLKFDVLEYEALLKSPAEAPQVEIKGNDTQMIIYTSGTTGPAKGVMESHSCMYQGNIEFINAMRFTSDDILFTCLPLFHANARVLCIQPALLLGTKAVVYERFSASQFWDWIRKAKATSFNSLGAMAHFIYSQPRQKNDADNPIRVCAAFPMPKEIYEDFEKRFNLKVVEGYGLTELGNPTYNPYDAPKIGSCGKANPNYEIMIVDENDFPVPPGTVGEIVARGRTPWTMSNGYYNMPEKTVDLMRNHFYHTGDGGYMDEDGYLFFADRLKDYIRRRGENISSFEVERSVNAHPDISESAAIAVKSDVSEDEVKIVVVVKEGKKLSPEALLDFCQKRMPYFAVPRFVEFVKQLPKTPTDRVQKNLLREAGITEATWDREKAGYKIIR